VQLQRFDPAQELNARAARASGLKGCLGATLAPGTNNGETWWQMADLKTQFRRPEWRAEYYSRNYEVNKKLVQWCEDKQHKESFSMY
jgi:hypothetical protein